jgi:hypothetical protein
VFFCLSSQLVVRILHDYDSTKLRKELQTRNSLLDGIFSFE